jgi:hypothetical protein
VNFGTTLLFVGCLDVFEKSPGVGITDDFQAYQTFLIFLAITLLTHAISAYCNKWLPWLEVRLSIAFDKYRDYQSFSRSRYTFLYSRALFPFRVKPLTFDFFAFAHRLSPSSGLSPV